MRFKYFFIFFIVVISNGAMALAQPQQTAIGRYVTIQNKPSTAQADLLSQSIQVRFPKNIQTIGEAMQYVLRYSRYSLVENSKQNTALKITLAKPLPLIDRNFGPMPLQDALSTLVGPAFSLLQDPLNREVNFVVKPNYIKYGHKQHETTV